MALQAAVNREGYSYLETVETLDEDTIGKSKERFAHLAKEGIIISGTYEDDQWRITDEVIKGVIISFQLDELHFMREIAPKLRCSLSEYKQGMRVVITSRFGYSLRSLQADSSAMRKFANELVIPSEYAQGQVLADLLDLLPGKSQFREDIRKELEDISPLSASNQKQRRLSHYQSYLRFSSVLEDFWKTASKKEKVLYFPVWFWYSVTGVLPLRPTECVLTPRRCIEQKD